MWEPRHLTTLFAFTACYRDSFTFTFCLARLIWPWRWRRCVPSKRRFTFNGPHGVIFRKTVLFVTIAVRTSNPTILRIAETEPIFIFTHLHLWSCRCLSDDTFMNGFIECQDRSAVMCIPLRAPLNWSCDCGKNICNEIGTVNPFM
jgi:hypothetical protein